jgi:tetratricopeptide (TPR) repeat protein
MTSCLLGPSLVLAAATVAPVAGQVDPQTLDKARILFDRGRTHFDLAEYDEAIQNFRAAYEITTAPLLLFNIGQAQRLKGNCRGAIDSYRHFLLLAPDVAQSAEASQHLRNLGSRCPETSSEIPETGPGKLISKSSTLIGKDATWEKSGSDPARQKIAGAAMPSTADAKWGRSDTAFLGVAIVLGASTMGLDLWNDWRFSRWLDEDRSLAAVRGPDEGAIRRQNSNDNFLSSIHRVDRFELTLAIATGITLASWCVVHYFWASSKPSGSLANRSGEVLVW